MEENTVQSLTVQVQSLTQSGADRLKSFVERIERLEDEAEATASDIKNVYDEAGSSGFDKKILRQVVKLRKQDRQKREEEETVRELYLQALGEI